ncbi:hypothetical protein F4779DRAFT_613914 [Xylariaceae sp. FL0662B]|nr:hypothetical protein F4779DRAFT_613914 [Xylariaceae sp. FL0662B]
MAPSIFNDNFLLRLPPATAVLLLSAAFGLSNGYALPRQTKTVALHELNVVPFPPAPTEPPISFEELVRRQSDNTICGYIGGNRNLPATCSAGSHCVLEQEHGVVGCCPNGVTCSTGVFTGCVDGNSGPQNEVNPYVYTCQGSNMCYRNQFDGGFYQYGCGTSTGMGTTVQTSAAGASSLNLQATSVPLTASPSSLSEPTTIGSSTPASTTGSSSRVSTASVSSVTSSASSSTTDSVSSSSLSGSTSSSESTSSTDSTFSSHSTTPPPTTSTSPISSSDTTAVAATSSSTVTPAPSTNNNNTDDNNVGAIVGGSVSGAVVLVALIAAALYLRKRSNARQGPGPTPPSAPTMEYISPIKSHGAAFAPLPAWQEEDPEHPNPRARTPPYNSAHNGPWQPGMAVAHTHDNSNGHGHHHHGISQPLRYHAGTGLTPVAEEEQHQQLQPSWYDDPSPPPTPREIDEFSRAYSSAGIGQDDSSDSSGDSSDRQPLTANPAESARSSPEGSGSLASSGAAAQSPPSSSGGGASRGANRPLWQQNRQQARNLMWL